MNNQNINFIRRIFLEKISRSLILINDITTYKEFRGGGYRPIFEKTKYLIIELAFLKVFISFEDFLEQSFTRYMCGYKTITNYSPVRYVLPKNLEHASKMALGNKPFMDWTRWSDVRELSKAFF